MKLIIAGGRDYSYYTKLKKNVDTICKGVVEEIIIISGGASGADNLGEQYAKDMGFNLITYHANWTKFGKRAGPIRNKKMAHIADMAIVFWDGKSRGTKNMIDTCRTNNIPCIIINY